MTIAESNETISFQQSLNVNHSQINYFELLGRHKVMSKKDTGKADYSFSSWEGEVPSIGDAQNLSVSVEEDHKNSPSPSPIFCENVLEVCLIPMDGIAPNIICLGIWGTYDHLIM